MAAQANAPIVIKRKKVVQGGGHHGGAWKVAYADFVTAMMAFFMLMWLLGATTEKQRKGIADYFNPTIPVNRVSGGGEGAFGGDSVFSESTLAQNGTGAGLERPTEQRQSRGELGVDASDEPSAAQQNQKENEQLEEAERLLLGVGGESMVSELLRRHVVTKLSDEGLIIELFDLEGAPLFSRENGEPTEVLVALIDEIASVIRLFDNDVAVNGYTQSVPLVVQENDTWAISTARASAARDVLAETQFPEAQIARVTGFADRKPAARNPLSLRNNRVELVMLRSGM